jgi:hypothetical protein
VFLGKSGCLKMNNRKDLRLSSKGRNYAKMPWQRIALRSTVASFSASRKRRHSQFLAVWLVGGSIHL